MKNFVMPLAICLMLPTAASAISTGAVRAVEVNPSDTARVGDSRHLERERLDDAIDAGTAEISDYTDEIADISRLRDSVVALSLTDPGSALAAVGVEKADADKLNQSQAQAQIGAELLRMEQRIAQLESYRESAKADLENAEAQRRRLNIPLQKLEAMPGIATQGGGGKIAPKLSVTSWDGKDFGKSDRWHYGYGVNVDIQAGKVTSAADEAADEFLLTGGDGNIDLSFAVGRRFGSTTDLSLWLGGTQSWLDTTVEENGEAVDIDDDIRRYRAGLLLQTRYFYLAGEWIKNDYSGNAESEFARMVDGEEVFKVSFITRIDDDFYLRYDSMEGETGNKSSVTLTKNINLF